MPGLNQLQQTRRPGPNLRDSSLGMQSGTPQASKGIMPSLSKPLISNQGIQQSVPDSGPNMSVDVPVQTTSKVRSKDRFKAAIIKGESTGLSREEAYKKIKDAGYTLEPGQYDSMSPKAQKVAERQDKVIEAVTVNKNNQNPLVRGFKGLVGGVKGMVEGAVEGVKKGVPQLRKDTKATIKDPNLSVPEKFMGVLFKEVLADFVSTDVIGGAVVGGATGAAKGLLTEAEREQAKEYMSTFIKEGSTVDQAIMKYNNLPPEQKKTFDYYAGGLLGLVDLMGVGAGKKVGKEFLEQGAETMVKATDVPGQIMGDISTDVTKGVQNMTQDVTSAIGNATEGAGNAAAVKLLSSQWKLGEPTVRKFEQITGENPYSWALRNQLVEGDIATTSKNAANFQVENMKNKIEVMKDRGETTIPLQSKVMAKKTADSLEASLLNSTYQKFDSIDKITPDELAALPQDQLKIYKALREFEKKGTTKYQDIEVVKELYDHYNPDGIRWGPDGKPISNASNEGKAAIRSYVQKFLEDAGEKNGVDIAKMNENIRAAYVFQRAADKAETRMANHNLIGLGDTQIALIGSVLDGGTTALGGLLLKKGIFENQKVRTSLARRLYNAKDLNRTPGTRDVAPSRAARIISNMSDSGDNAAGQVNYPIKPKPTPIAPGGLPQESPLITPDTGRGIPQRQIREINLPDTASQVKPVPVPIAPGQAPAKVPTPYGPGKPVNTLAWKEFHAAKGEEITDVIEFKKGRLTPDGKVTEVGFSGRQPYFKVEGDIKHRVRTQGVAKKPDAPKPLDNKASLESMSKAGQRNDLKIKEGLNQLGVKSIDDLTAPQLKEFGELVRARNFNDAWYKKLEDLKKDIKNGGDELAVGKTYTIQETLFDSKNMKPTDFTEKVEIVKVTDDMVSYKSDSGGGFMSKEKFLEKIKGDKNLTEAGKSSKIDTTLPTKTKTPMTAKSYEEATITSAEPIKVYRGTGKGIGNTTFVKGTYFADSKKFASEFGEVTEGIIPKGSKIFDFDRIKADPDQTLIPKETMVDPDALTKLLIDKGYDATKNTNSRGVEYVLLNKAQNSLADLAKNSKTFEEFSDKVMKNWTDFKDEIKRISNGRINATPLSEVWREVKKINAEPVSNKKAPQLELKQQTKATPLPSKTKITNEDIGYKKKPLTEKELARVMDEEKYITDLEKSNSSYVYKHGAEKFREAAKAAYVKYVKNYISKGYEVPAEVIAKNPEFAKAVDTRARYEKGLYTSFSNKDLRIDNSTKSIIGGGVKRQDGKPITLEQREQIVKGVQDFGDVLGIDIKKLAEGENIVFVHLSGKNAFLRKASGLYRRQGDLVSVSVGGKETVTEVLPGGKRETVNLDTTMQHELGHALDYMDGERLLQDLVVQARRNYNPVTSLKKYYRKNEEVTARLIEQYVAVKKGLTSYYDKPGFWKKDQFEKYIPEIERKIKEKFKDYLTR